MLLFGNGVNYSEGKGGMLSVPRQSSLRATRGKEAIHFACPGHPAPLRHVTELPVFTAGGGDDKPALLGSPRPLRSIFLLPFELWHGPARRFQQPKGL